MDVYFINCLLAVLLAAKLGYDRGYKIGMSRIYAALTNPIKAGNIKETGND